MTTMKDLWRPITTEDDLPKRKGDGSYEQQQCLVILKGEAMLLMWNCEHLCWDDAGGDDWYCNAMDPTHWQPVEGPEKPKNQG